MRELLFIAFAAPILQQASQLFVGRARLQGSPGRLWDESATRLAQSDLPGNALADITLNVTKSLPFPDNSFDAIYAEKVFEPIDRFEAMDFAREAFRVLRPGGVLRLTTPDLTQVCRIYLGQHELARIEQLESAWLSGEFSNEIWINAVFHESVHKHIHSVDILSRLLGSAGFQELSRCGPR